MGKKINTNPTMDEMMTHAIYLKTRYPGLHINTYLSLFAARFDRRPTPATFRNWTRNIK